MPATVRHPGVEPTLIDRIRVADRAEWAVRRLRARVVYGAIVMYTGAKWITAQHDRLADQQGECGRRSLAVAATTARRSRHPIRNNAIAAGAISGTVTSVVGTGLTLESAIDPDYLGMSDTDAQAWQKTATREFKLWADCTDCDITRTQDFYGLQDLIFRSTLENGDAISLLPFVKRLGSVYDLRVQAIEADRLVNKSWAGDTPALAGGVAMDQSGAPTAYHILDQHPGNLWGTSGLNWNVYPAFGAKTGRRNVLHHYRRLRPGQTRGMPYLAAVIEIIKQLGRYSDAEIMAAVVSGLFSVFVTSERGGIAPSIPGISQKTGATATDQDIKMGNGTIVDLKPGEEISTAAPGRPNANFDPFFQACLRQIGMGLEIPFEVLIKHFDSSYTAARGAILEAWKFYRGRRAFLVQTFCDPVYEAWMEEAVSKGRLSAPGFFDDPAIRRAYLGCRWHGDAMPQVDPVKEANAARLRVELGVSDRLQETAAITGGDWDTTHKEQVREATMRREGGLDPNVPPAPSVSAIDTSDGGDDQPKPQPFGGQ